MTKPSHLLKAVAACGLIIIVTLSLLPGSAMVRLHVPGWIEHFCAYYAAATLLVLALPGRRNLALIMLGLVALAGLMEVLQHFSPGRTPKVADFLAGSTGALLGAAIGTWFRVKNVSHDPDTDTTPRVTRHQPPES